MVVRDRYRRLHELDHQRLNHLGHATDLRFGSFHRWNRHDHGLAHRFDYFRRYLDQTQCRSHRDLVMDHHFESRRSLIRLDLVLNPG